MHPSELNEEERGSFDRAMDTILAMPREDQGAALEHEVASSIRYATAREDETLRDWAKGLLTTLRLNQSKSYRAAMESHRPPARPIREIRLSEVISSLRH